VNSFLEMNKHLLLSSKNRTYFKLKIKI